MVARKRACVGGAVVCVTTMVISYYSAPHVPATHFIQRKRPSVMVKPLSMGEECDELHVIARDMLDGAHIGLPFETNNTNWNFHNEEINLDLLKKTSFVWNYGGGFSKKTQDLIKLYNTTQSRNIKSTKHFITFANKCCQSSKLKAVMRALHPGGFDTTKIHDLTSLSKGFRQAHASILNQSRGSGYWLWKPYIILKTVVENMADGDILMYQDAGAFLIQDVGPLLKLCSDAKYGILIFYLTLLEQHYTKRDAFILMNLDDNHVYKTYQRMASFILIQKNCKSLQFIMEWLAYASDPRLSTDMSNTLGKPNLPRFKGHRHDQSVLSLLSKKWGLLAYRTPSQYGNLLGYKSGPYPQIIMHNRDRS